MKLTKDLLKKESKIYLQLILGVFVLGYTILLIVTKKWKNQPISPVDWRTSIIFFIMSVYHIIEGSGYSISKLFGKAFVLIDIQQVSVKQSVFDKVQIMDWNTIQLIACKEGALHIQKTDNSQTSIDLSKLDIPTKKEIKEIVYTIAEQKGIKLDNTHK